MNVPCPQTQQEIPWVSGPGQRSMQALPSGNVLNRWVPLFANRAHNGLAGNAPDRLFARRINIGNKDQIRAVECRAKVFPQSLSSRVTVGLKHHDNPFSPDCLSGTQSFPDFCRMMSVVVYYQKIFIL